MRKTCFILFVLALTAVSGWVVSCGKQSSGAESPMTFDIQVLETKTENEVWSKGDKLLVFFDEIGGKYVSLVFDGINDWMVTPSETFLESDFKAVGNKRLTALYFPVAVDVSYADGKFSFSGAGEQMYSYYLYEKFMYIVDGSTVVATLTMGKKPADFVVFHIAGLTSGLNKYTMGCPLVSPVACTGIGTDGTVMEDVRMPGTRIAALAGGKGAFFAGRLLRSGTSADYNFLLTNGDRYYTLTRKNQVYVLENQYDLPAISEIGNDKRTFAYAHDLCADLGLSVLWAKSNLGATSESEAGDYFSWGESNGYITGKTTFSRSEYTFAGKTLQPEDDAAHVSLGGDFRMPTSAEWEELMNNCNWEWKGNGYLVTGRKDGFTDKSIFLPVTSYRSDNDLSEQFKNAGCYWSSTPDTGSDDNAMYAALDSDRKEISALLRHYGCAVRPVFVYKGENVKDYTHYDYVEE